VIKKLLAAMGFESVEKYSGNHIDKFCQTAGGLPGFVEEDEVANANINYEINFGND
jgi:hypothetical protein